MNSTTQLPAADYEPRDASARQLFLTGAGLALGLVLSLAISFALYFAIYRETPRPGAMGRETSFKFSSAAQSDIQADWRRQDEAVREHLHSYGWVDRDAGIVRIPIERAMQQMVEENRKGGGR